ncbi:hypothetical protein JAAARDRAFT_191020, partial [Jaapia argillacea MUCL 33604]
MPPRDSDLVINFICRILLICLTGIHLGIAICSHVRGTLIHVHNQLLQLVITTTRATYRPIAVPAVHFQFDENGYVSSFLGDLYNEEDFERPWNTAPTPPPPAAPSVGTPDFATTPPRSPSPPSPREQEFLRHLIEIRQRRPELDPLDTLVMPIDARRFAPVQFNEHLIFWVVCLLEALRTIINVLGEVRPYLTNDELLRIEGPVEDIRNIREALVEAINRGEWRREVAEHTLERRYNHFGDEDPLFAPDEDIEGNPLLDVLIPIPQTPRIQEITPEVIDLTEDDDRVVKGSGTSGDPFVLLETHCFGRLHNYHRKSHTDNTFPPDNDDTSKECEVTPCPNRYTYTGEDDYDYSVEGEEGFRPVTPEHTFWELRRIREPQQIPAESPEAPARASPTGAFTPPSPVTPTQVPLPVTPLPQFDTLVLTPRVVSTTTPTPLPLSTTQLSPVMATVQMTDAQFNQLLDTLRGSNAKVEKVAAPGLYDGDKKEYDDWRDNVTAYIDANTRAYGTDKAKFLYVTSLLRGEASTWRKHIRTQWTQHEGLLAAEEAKQNPDAAKIASYKDVITWARFLTVLDERFGEINREEKARIRMLETKQGNRTADEYLTDYNRFVLEAKLQLPDAFHIDNFKRNVNVEIIRKIETGITKPPTSF